MTESEEKSEEIEENNELLRLYNGAQLLLIQYMINTGAIKDTQEYVDNYAEAFEMLAKGEISVPKRIRWEEVRDKVKKLVNKLSLF